MNELVKNPFIAFLAGLLALWVVFKLLKIVLGFFWLFVLAFIILYVVNSSFRLSVRAFLNSLFNR